MTVVEDRPGYGHGREALLRAVITVVSEGGLRNLTYRSVAALRVPPPCDRVTAASSSIAGDTGLSTTAARPEHSREESAALSE